VRLAGSEKAELGSTSRFENLPERNGIRAAATLGATTLDLRHGVLLATMNDNAPGRQRLHCGYQSTFSPYVSSAMNPSATAARITGVSYVRPDLRPK
jgi:hypothetical protein